MSVSIGDHTFDHVRYDARGDVLYLSKGSPERLGEGWGADEGHHVRFEADGSLKGLTLVFPQQRLQLKGSVIVDVPDRLHFEATADDLAPALSAA